MTDAIVTFRVDKQTYGRMKEHPEINWSAVLRDTVERMLPAFDKAKADWAGKQMDALRERGAFSHGKPSLEILHEWRRKRSSTHR